MLGLWAPAPSLQNGLLQVAGVCPTGELCHHSSYGSGETVLVFSKEPLQAELNSQKCLALPAQGFLQAMSQVTVSFALGQT